MKKTHDSWLRAALPSSVSFLSFFSPASRCRCRRCHRARKGEGQGKGVEEPNFTLEGESTTFLGGNMRSPGETGPEWWVLWYPPTENVDRQFDGPKNCTIEKWKRDSSLHASG